jgi:hypothetical protein
VTYGFFVGFLVIMSIIIVNLLVGLAVDDIKAVQDQAVLKRLAMQVELVLDVERMLPTVILRKFTARKDLLIHSSSEDSKRLLATEWKDPNIATKDQRADTQKEQTLYLEQLSDDVAALKAIIKDMASNNSKLGPKESSFEDLGQRTRPSSHVLDTSHLIMPTYDNSNGDDSD